MLKKALSVAVLAAMITLHSSSAYAWKIVYDPTNHSETLETKLQMIKQVQQQAEQLRHELANLAKLNPGEASASIAKIQELMSTMNTIRNETNAIGTSYKELMQEFDKLRPDYSVWNGVSAEEYAKQTDKIRAAWEAAVEQSMKSQGIASPQEQQKTADHLSRLIDASQNAEGAMGALQAANQIAALQIQELQKMQAIMADSMRTQNLYYQKKIDAEMQAKKISEDFMRGVEKSKESKFTEGNSKIANYPE